MNFKISKGSSWSKCLILIAGLLLQGAAYALSVKDVAHFEGERGNQLVGYGLVVGLDGTGDQTNQARFTAQSLGALLSQSGVVLPPGTNLQSKNVAAVMVTGTLPAFAGAGQNIDVTVSALGNAKSLRGGTLVLSPLKGVDGKIYALAQGAVVLGTAPGKGLPAQQNVGRIPGGAIIEKEAPGFEASNGLTLLLHKANFEMAVAIASNIQKTLGVVANPVDARKIEIVAPNMSLPRLAAKIQALPVDAISQGAKVVINARTGSVVMGQEITVGDFAISHGTLSINVNNGATKDTVAMVKQTTLSDVVKTLNSMGATPQDIISILQAMKDAGALNATIEVI